MINKFAIASMVAGLSLISVSGLAMADTADRDSDRNVPVIYVKDSAITMKIKAKLAEMHFTSLGRIHVDTDANGIVYLTGTARSQDAIDKAVKIAKSTERVTAVENKLTVRKDD